MVVSDPDIHRAARLNLERHRDEAVTKACDMVRNLKERGDNEAADTWLQIIARLSVAARVGRHDGRTGDGGVGDAPTRSLYPFRLGLPKFLRSQGFRRIRRPNHGG